MKVRSGFVSNSSTSSFILAGWKGEPSDEVLKVLADKHNFDLSGDRNTIDLMYDILSRAGFNYYHEEDLWGIDLCNMSDDGIEEIDFKEMRERLAEVEGLAKELGLEPPRVFAGICAC